MNLQIPIWIKVMVYLRIKLSKNEKIHKIIISKELDVTYSHIVNTLKNLLDKGYVKFNRKGRNIYVELTGKGIKLSEHCKRVYEATL